MTDENDPDKALLAELHQLLDDPIPDDVINAASAFFTLRTLDDELAELAALDDDELVGAVRGASATVSLTFRSDSTTIEIELDRQARRLTIQILPAQPMRVLVESADGTRGDEQTSDIGVFEISNVHTGPSRLRATRVAPEPAPPIVTDWFVV